MGILYIKRNQQAVQGFPVNRSYTKAEADAKFGSGSSQGYQAPLSGGLSGTNTWTTAPNVLIIDGKPTQKLQTDGTVMWTGTTTTTLTNAPLPTFDIFASA